MLELLPIKERLEDNQDFLSNPDCEESLEMSVKFMAGLGYFPPWVCYYARLHNQLVGSAAFKGRPKDGKVEIAYGVFPRFMQQGIGKAICAQLVQLAGKTDPTVRVTARTLQEKNYSTNVLVKNGFALLGTVIDADDGEVWEWEHIK